MARMVKHDLTGPHKLEKGGETIWVCACGLLKNTPSCDGSHKKTRDEEPGALYVCDAQGRVTVPTEY